MGSKPTRCMRKLIDIKKIIKKKKKTKDCNHSQNFHPPYVFGAFLVII